MPDITPDSPLAAFWPDGEGGLSGAHARGRLAAAGITTVAALTASTAGALERINGMGRRAHRDQGTGLMDKQQPNFAGQCAALFAHLQKALTPERILRGAIEEYNRKMGELNRRG